jgi:hypothetical protein
LSALPHVSQIEIPVGLHVCRRIFGEPGAETIFDRPIRGVDRDMTVAISCLAGCGKTKNGPPIFQQPLGHHLSNYTVAASRYSPHTPRKRLLISPTVA